MAACRYSLCLAYGLPLASSKSSGRPDRILYWQRFSWICNTSSYFDFHLLTALSLRSTLESFAITRLFLDSIAYLATWAAPRPILGVGIGCKVSGYLFVGTVDRLWSHCAWQRVFRIRKSPRLNRKYFNRAMIASEPCYNGTIYDRTFVN